MRLPIAPPLGAAIVALAGGARETLLQLDLGVGLLGVFLVGFGADSIKKLFTSTKTGNS